MTTKQSERIVFPKKFLWGAATSAHQVEGGLVNQWTTWELEHAKRLSVQAPHQFGDIDSWPRIKKEAIRPDNYVSGRGVDHYHRYEEDFAILKSLNMNAFRFCIEWARIEPQEGAWDAAAIAHYRTYLRTLKKMGITPVVTLFHFTLPEWFAAKGGFEKRRNIKYFVYYVEKVLSELGRDIEWIVTINEPTVYAGESYLEGHWSPNKTRKRDMLRVLYNLVTAHKKVYKLTRARKKWKVSMAHHLIYCYPGDDAILSRASARVANYLLNTWVLRRVRRYSDFLAINYYFARRIYGYRVHDPYLKVSDLGWDMQPDKLQYLLEDVAERYRLPIMITENGLADGADSQRQWWLTETIKAMHEALKRDIKLIGYLHWSLLDNFEWDKGYWPKFGLVAVDRQTMARTVRPSARWFGAVIKKLRK
ncbi:family 1 glycosylhydrolase [Candidatus Saccharibacteria bacterium oral taxon 488]|nr:family 1 glycosylhydrolase [Candidatus Saccharibacteria bacterium oral taxon 488]